jgi:hypothetical protein
MRKVISVWCKADHRTFSSSNPAQLPITVQNPDLLGRAEQSNTTEQRVNEKVAVSSTRPTAR